MNTETRTLFTFGPLSIVAKMCADEDTDPADQDFDTAEQKDAYRIVVRVEWHGVTIGADSLRIEHGKVAEGVDADAWGLIPAAYPGPGGVDVGSPLLGVVTEAIGSAKTWLATIDAAAEVLTVAEKWADPNAPTDA